MANQRFASVPAMFLDRIAATPNARAYQFPEGAGWGSMTWGEAGERVRHIACGLASLGIEREDRAGIVSKTSLEWILADLGIMGAGGATTTIYPSNAPEECQYIIADSATRFVFAEDDGQVAKLAEVRGETPSLEKVIVINGTAGHDGWVMTLDELEAAGKKYNDANPGWFEETGKSLKAEDLATLIYTSGTTGRPKGVELLHSAWSYEGWGIAEMGILDMSDHQYLWLPLSHSFGKVLEAAQIQIGFVTTVDGRIPKLVENLGVVKPTFMAAAPRIFEKVYNKVVQGVEEAGGLKKTIFNWSVGVGREVSKLRQARQEPAGLLAIKYKIANKLVFSKLKEKFGGRVKFFISGSAPLSMEMAEFFHASDVLILEGYGLTESSAASFVNRPGTFKFGTVGPPLPGTEVKIAEEDGEILLRGDGIMRGYRNLPDVTAETLTEDGWLLTGDIGELDADGFLRITDRKKDLIKTSGGKYVAPQKLEGSLKALCPYLSQVLVHGNRRNFCTALVTLDEEGIRGWADEHGLGGKSVAEIAKSPTTIAMVQEAVDKLNSTLASYETIKKFGILERDWSIEEGELTASLKVKRKVIEKRYVGVLDSFYADALKKI